MMMRLAFGLVIFPVVAWAEVAPAVCAGQFFEGEMPEVGAPVPGGQILCFEEFVLMHSAATKTPVWVAEYLSPERVEAKVKREDAFHAEVDLPEEERAELRDYARSGYARGHMAPAGDMSTREAQRESFTLANMVPQNMRNNSVPWKGIEDSVRQLAETERGIFVVTGPIYLSSTTPTLIGDGVRVPDLLFKAVYDRRLQLAGAYVLSNESEPTCREMSVAQLKVMTGVDVFPELKPEVKASAMELPLPLRLVCEVEPSKPTVRKKIWWWWPF